jgi:8-oxo-dGTP pyrophosphatase MutT (NUDIX family)
MMSAFPTTLSNNPKICYTAAGFLIHDNKVLLVKHKKLGFWLAPGGHIDEDELPHQTAEREFFEETGVRVAAYDPVHELIESDLSEYFPSPIATNLHWISKENYQARINSAHPDKRSANKLWSRGCEQHLCFTYLFNPLGSVDFKQNEEETDGIAWFSQEEVEDLETIEDVRKEVKLAFKLSASR